MTECPHSPIIHCKEFSHSGFNDRVSVDGLMAPFLHSYREEKTKIKNDVSESKFA